MPYLISALIAFVIGLVLMVIEHVFLGNLELWKVMYWVSALLLLLSLGLHLWPTQFWNDQREQPRSDDVVPDDKGDDQQHRLPPETKEDSLTGWHPVVTLEECEKESHLLFTPLKI